MHKVSNIIAFGLLGWFASAASSQQINPASQITWPRVTGAGTPTGMCNSAKYGQPYTNTTANTQYVCSAGGWTLVGSTSSSGVSQIIAGTNVTVTPSGGTGVVTISASASGSGTVTTTGTPTTGNLTKFSGSTSITNAAAGVDYLVNQFAGDCLSQFNFTETSGTSFVDSCNGYTGTISGTLPTRNGIGYQFVAASRADFPTQVNNFGSMIAVVNFPVYATGTNGGDAIHTYFRDTLLMGAHSTTDKVGVDVFARPTIDGFGMYGVYTDAFIHFPSGGGANTSAPDVFAGPHVIGVTCVAGGGVKLYKDGVLIYNGTADSNIYGCDGGLSSGNYQIGVSSNSTNVPSANIGFNGTVYSWRFTSGALSDTDMMKNSILLQQVVQGRGVVFGGSPYVNPLPALIFAGDSITCGFGITGGSSQCGPGTNSSFAYGNVITGLTNTYNVQIYGQSGALVQAQIANLPELYGPKSQAAMSASIVSLFEGTNNGFYGSNTPIQTWQLNQAWITQTKQRGPRTMLMGIIDGNNGGVYTFKNTLAGYQRAGWRSSGANAFVDLTADPLLGVDGASANTTYFQVDATHPTAAGQVRIALAAACGVNWIDGSTPEAMRTAAVTGTTYTTTCSDGGLNINAASNAVNVTLNSALWQTGRVIKLCNITPTGTNAVTITAPSDYTFNNVSGSTSITLAPYSCVNFTSTYTGNTTTGGDYWSLSAPYGSGGSSYITSLTTTGTSGPATVSGGVLNIPQYSGGGGSGTVTTTGSPASGNMAKFSGATSITNAVSGTDYAPGTNPTGGQNNYAPLASPTLTGTVTAPLYVASTGFNGPSYVIPQSGTATSSANSNPSGAFGTNGSYWTGSTSSTDGWAFSHTLGTGANPTSTFSFTHSGSTGLASVAMPAATITASTAAAGLNIVNTYAGANVGDFSLLCPNTLSYCLMAFGTAIGSGTSVLFGWVPFTSSSGMGSLQTYGSSSPIEVAATYLGTSSQMAVGNGGSFNTPGFSCASGVLLCVGSTSNTAAPFTVDSNGTTIAAIFQEPLHTPTSSSETCTTGAIRWDTGFIYVCTATNTFKRVALSTF